MTNSSKLFYQDLFLRIILKHEFAYKILKTCKLNSNADEVFKLAFSPQQAV